MHGDRGIPSYRLGHAGGVPLDDGRRARRLLDEVCARRASADRLEPERTGAGIQIEDHGAAQRVGGLERPEQGLAYPVARGPGAGIGDLERERACPAGDDARHTPTIAVGV